MRAFFTHFLAARLHSAPGAARDGVHGRISNLLFLRMLIDADQLARRLTARFIDLASLFA